MADQTCTDPLDLTRHLTDENVLRWLKIGDRLPQRSASEGGVDDADNDDH